MTKPPLSLIAQALDSIRDGNRYRRLCATAAEPGGRLRRDGRSLVDFSSNDYLGLAHHPLLAERSAEWARLHGAGSGASRLVTGTSEAHLALEAKIAAFKGSEAALLFPSGWQANASVLPALIRAMPGALVFTDRLIHASLHQGCAAAGARQIRFRHNDMDHLQALLDERGGEGAPLLIVTESLFSMDGDLVDLDRLGSIARAHGAFLYLDDAHATGVMGPRGAGLSAQFPGAADLVMGTFSKALGAFGAYVAGPRLVCDYLVNACGGFVFTTAPPPAMLGAIDAALDLVPAMDAERARLAAIGTRVREALAQAGLDTGASASQIVPVIVGGERETLALSKALEEQGMLAAAIRPPTVPPGSSRLRLALRAAHADADVEALISALVAHGPRR